MHDELAYFLNLRLRFRSNPEGRAIVDRCLAIIAAADGADGVNLLELEHLVVALSDELALRFGAPRFAPVH